MELKLEKIHALFGAALFKDLSDQLRCTSNVTSLQGGEVFCLISRKYTTFLKKKGSLQ